MFSAFETSTGKHMSWPQRTNVLRRTILPTTCNDFHLQLQPSFMMQTFLQLCLLAITLKHVRLTYEQIA